MKKTSAALVMGALASSLLLGPPASAATTCVDAADIGVTVVVRAPAGSSSYGLVKSSASYTSCKGHEIRRATLYVETRQMYSSSWGRVASTEVVRRPSNSGGTSPNVLAFSTRDLACYPTNYYRARYIVQYVSGDEVVRLSNIRFGDPSICAR